MLDLKIYPRNGHGPYVNFSTLFVMHTERVNGLVSQDEYISKKLPSLESQNYCLEDSVYAFFYDCFEKANEKGFNYYGPSFISPEQLKDSKKYLEQKKLRILKITTPEDLIRATEEVHLGNNLIATLVHFDPAWKERVQKIKEALIVIVDKFLQIVEACINNKASLEIDGI